MPFARSRVAGVQLRRRAAPARFWGSLGTLTLVVLVAAGCGPASNNVSAGAVSPPPSSSSTATGESSSVAVALAPKGSSLVATASGSSVTVRKSPGSPGSSGSPGSGAKHVLANPTSIGAPLTFLVLARQPGWLKVELPVRPNGSVGWVAESEVSTSTTPYRLVITMATHRLDVMYEGHRIARHPVGVGTVATPTPPGTYYLTELIKPPNPKGAYGPYAFGLSAFSNTLKTFAGGPGQLGLHGTDAPKGLGHDVSHGCLRVANAVITELASRLPLGTPVEIRA
jgi:lipoprotein-anchoring transpeptidase ErfK/SrfK